MHYKDTVMVLYPGGAYGTFVLWCLYYFSGQLPDAVLPFLPNGSSHGFKRHWFDAKEKNLPPVEDYLAGDTTVPFLRTHGSNGQQTLQEYFDSKHKYFSKIVVLVSDDSSRMLMLNNKHTKTTKSREALLKEIKEIYKKQFAVETEEVPIWQQREMISYWYDRQFTSEDQWSNLHSDNLIQIPVRQIVDNFESTLKNIFCLLDLELVLEDQIQTVKQQWLPLQKYTNSDQYCRDMALATYQGTLFAKPRSMNLWEEAYVQYLLRKVYKKDLKCYNLDVFPTSSLELKELLIDV